MFGFLNVYKPKGITSHDVVDQLRRATHIKQIGHTGTLDPFAQGVLPVCIGKATRLIEYLDDDKEYLATVNFGKSTDTYDLEGRFISETDKKVSKDDILKELENFKGEITQLPPMYSAVKVDGKKLYEYARAGKTVEVKPRVVNIYRIDLVSFDEVLQSAKIVIECSKGTYIRSIAHDLGQKLGTGAYLSELIRTRAGNFDVEHSVKNYTENVEENLINPLNILNLPKYDINSDEYKKVIQGQIFCKNSIAYNGLVILVYNGKINAIANIDNSIVKVKKVFV